MISYDVRALDGFSLKTGPTCTNVFVSNEKALVWTSSQRGIVEGCKEKELLSHLLTKTKIFKVHY